MTGRTAWAGIAVALLLSLVAKGVPAHADDSSAVLAQVGSRNITLNDLTQRESARLLNARNQYYLAQRDALQDLIDQSLLEEEAKRQNTSVDNLLARKAYGNLKDPTEDQMQVYYEALDTDQSFSALRGKILDHIRQTRRAKARARYVAELRAASPPKVMLEPPTAAVTVDAAPRRGPENAPVVLVEFADYQCPYCQRIEPALEKLEKEYPGKLAVVYKDLPLPSHPFARKAAEAAHCAGDQGKFWEYHDALFDAGSNLDRKQLDAIASHLNLDSRQFDRCLDSNQQESGVEKDFAQGQALGLTGTPSFFINEHFLSGADYASLDQLIRSQLSHQAAAKAVDP